MSAIDGLLTPAVAEELVDGVAGAFDAQRLAIGIQRFLRGLAAVVELAAKYPAAEEAREEPQQRLDQRCHRERGGSVAGDAGRGGGTLHSLWPAPGPPPRPLPAKRMADKRCAVDSELIH